jgi:hypothetical protein
MFSPEYEKHVFTFSFVSTDAIDKSLKNPVLLRMRLYYHVGSKKRK